MLTWMHTESKRVEEEEIEKEEMEEEEERKAGGRLFLDQSIIILPIQALCVTSTGPLGLI